jgi:hypothetical protein
MSHDPLYTSEDKTRLLQELESVTSTANRLPALPNPAHVEELHELFGKVVGLKKEEIVEAPVQTPVVRMTHTQLKAMRGVSAKAKGPSGTGPSFSQTMIMFVCSIKDFFKATKNRGALTCAKKRDTSQKKKN